MLRRSSVFAAEVMDAFDRSQPTDKELVAQAKALCRDYVHSRLNRAGIGWTKPDPGGGGGPGSALGDASSVLLWLGESLQRRGFSRLVRGGRGGRGGPISPHPHRGHAPV